jgi:hypothetical protein
MRLGKTDGASIFAIWRAEMSNAPFGDKANLEGAGLALHSENFGLGNFRRLGE